MYLKTVCCKHNAAFSKPPDYVSFLKKKKKINKKKIRFESPNDKTNKMTVRPAKTQIRCALNE